MDKKLLREEPIFEPIEIQEMEEATEDGLKLLKIKGIASRGDMFNKNNRMYPTKVLRKVAEKAMARVKKGTLTGMLDHPGWFSGDSLKGTAIKFTNMWMEGDDLKFEGNVIPTTWGKELAVLLQSKVGIGMSTRGYGTMLPFKKKDGKEDPRRVVVQDDYELLGVDAVSEPSNQYSKIAQFEHKEGGNEVDLEMLKNDHPELVEEIKKEVATEITAEFEKDFDKKVSDAAEKVVEDKVKEAKETFEVEFKESDDYKKMQDFINGIAEAAKPFMPGQQEFVESEKQKEIDDLKVQLQASEEAKDTAVKEAADLIAAREADEAKKKIADHITAKVEGHRFAAQIADRLANCASVEEVDASFDKEVEYIDSLLTDKEDPKGSGNVGNEDHNDSTKNTTALDEAKKRQRKLAGIEENKEGGK